MDKSVKLFYTPPKDECFEELRTICIRFWRTFDEVEYVDEKINRIRWRLINKDRTQILPCAMCDDIQGATTQVAKAIERFRQTKAYKEHVIPLARLGRRFDEGLKEGK